MTDTALLHAVYAQGKSEFWYLWYSSLSPTPGEVYPHLINVGFGHVTHFGQFSVLAEWIAADLTQVEISNVFTWLGLFFFGFHHHPGKNMIQLGYKRHINPPTESSQDSKVNHGILSY